MALDDIHLLSPASRHIYRRIYDALPIPGISIPDWWGMERETYCLGSTACHIEREKPLPGPFQLQLSLFQHWRTHIRPTDLTKLPDLLDFLVARGIPANHIQVESAFELSSDHSPVIAKIGASIINKSATPKLTTTHTNWDMFRAYINL